MEIAMDIEAAVDELTGELIELLQRLIRIPTVNPPGDGYEELCAALRATFDGLGYATEIVRVPPERLDELAPHAGGRPRPSLLATLEHGPGPTIHLNGHYDVVPVGNDWTRDPFGGELDAGWIYGRGAADMKSGLAAQVIAVEALRRTTGWAGTIVHSAVPDEETVGVDNAGMGFLVEQGRVVADAVIITEPFGPDGVGIGHKGAIWGEITLHGKQAHGSSPRLGYNAVEAMARYLARLDAELRPRLDERITELGVTPPESIHSTMSFDTIHGGAATNIVPDRCTVTFNRRLLPGEDLDEARRELLAPLEGQRYDYRETYSTEPTLVSTDEPVVQAACRAVRRLGLEPRILISAGSDDQRFVVHRAGITNSLVYGPGTTGLSHISDERISVDDLVLGTKGLALILADVLQASSST
jgi:succinyl-diaminopimelate desuccinylase